MNIPKFLMSVAFLAIVLSANIAVAVSLTEDSVDSSLENQESNDVQPQIVSTFVQPDSNQEETSTKGGSTKETSTQNAKSSSFKIVTSSTTKATTSPTTKVTTSQTTLSEDEIKFNDYLKFNEYSKSFNDLVDTTCSTSQGPDYKSSFIACIRDIGENIPDSKLKFSFTDSNQDKSEIYLFEQVIVPSAEKCDRMHLSGSSATEQSKYEEALSCVKSEYKSLGLELITGWSENEIRFNDNSRSFSDLVDTTCSKYQGPDYKSSFIACIRDIGENNPDLTSTFSFTDSNQDKSEIYLYFQVIGPSAEKCDRMHLSGSSATEQSKYEEALSCIKSEYKSLGLELIN